MLAAPPGPNEPYHIPPSPPECPDCNGAGYYLEAVPYGHPNFGKLLPCRCKLAEQARHAAQRRGEVLARLRQEMGTLADCTFALELPPEYTAAERRDLQRAIQIARGYASDPQGWLYLYGPSGAAKSHLAAAIGNARAQQGDRVAYASAPALLRFIRSGFKDGSADERVAALTVTDLLILDDLGTEYHAAAEIGRMDHANATLFEIVDARINYARPTVITSNMARREHEPRIASRIAQAVREIYLDLPDYRELLLRRRTAAEKRGAA